MPSFLVYYKIKTNFAPVFKTRAILLLTNYN